MGDVCRLLTEEDEQLGLSTLDYIPLMRQAAETPQVPGGVPVRL